MSENPHIGSTVEDLLRDIGLLEEIDKELERQNGSMSDEEFMRQLYAADLPIEEMARILMVSLNTPRQWMVGRTLPYPVIRHRIIEALNKA